HDALVYDVGRATPHNFYTGARLLRHTNVWRSYQLEGTPLVPPPEPGADTRPGPVTLVSPKGREQPASTVLHGYDRLGDGVRIRWRWHFPSGPVEVEDTLRVRVADRRRRLVRELRFTGVPERAALEVRDRVAGSGRPEVLASVGQMSKAMDGRN